MAKDRRTHDQKRKKKLEERKRKARRGRVAGLHGRKIQDGRVDPDVDAHRDWHLRSVCHDGSPGVRSNGGRCT